MIISRNGTSKDYGTSRIEIKQKTISWNEIDKSIEIMAQSVQDFNTESKHTYKISIPLSDITEIVRILGQDAVKKSASDLELALGEQSKALNRLVFAASGLVNNNVKIEPFKFKLPKPTSKVQ
ncbi:hypothetical protein [Methylomonas sp. AM2-LC]|uniref:hypothetical protein n=1 Tax=Methylomonas sp. AM2-LC TaxID=3153301 RepID=UPI003266CBB3